MKNFLNSVKIATPKGNTFDLTHDVKMSGNMGNLMPICCIDAVPGDFFNIGCEAMVRLAPMVAPIMHRVNVTMHYFFVPKRLLWPNWKNYITNTKVDDVLPSFPTITIGDDGYTKLCDYLGLPQPQVGSNVGVSAMPFAAYQMVYNEYYRDQNLIDPVPFELEDGLQSDNTELITLRRRAWEHDYFTAALPFAQKGDAVEIPISGDVVLKDPSGGLQLLKKSDGSPATTNTALGTQNLIPNLGTSPAGEAYNLDPNGTMEVQNADTTINDLRKAYALQRLLEKMARGGTRLTEFIRTIFGVRSSDARLQRPEYITGLQSPIMIGEVLNTTGTEDAPQGNMAGHGVGVSDGKYGKFFCEEHGYILGIMSVRPRTAYQQGVPKHFLKINDPFEHFLPDFAHIGEQEVKNLEVYVDHSDANGTFGYMPRYSEYKFENNRVAGDFKTTLNFWHMGRIFASDPALNKAFVECDPTHRVFAVTDTDKDKLWMHVVNKITARRLMPKFGTPTF